MALIIALAFGGVAIATQMDNGRAASVDRSLTLWMHEWSGRLPELTRILIGWTTIHGTIGMLIATAVVCSGMLLKGYRGDAMTMLIGVVGVMLINVGLKHLFKRVRPYFDDPWLNLGTYSFPSGHTASSVVFYGLLSLFFCNLVKSHLARILIIGSATVLITTVGFSRIYLGVHYLSDVAAAALEGCCWILLILSIQSRSGSRTGSNTDQ